jgi:hypothetical protein
MSDLPSDFDLKFLPDWLKESPSQNRYANYQGESSERHSRSDRSNRGPRPQSNQRQDRRAPRPVGGNREAGRNSRREDRGPGRPRPSDGRSPSAGKVHSLGQAPAPQLPAVRVEFLPETGGAIGIAKQIRSGFRAYPLFGTARLFLEKPERHRVRITSLDASKLLYQLEDGPVSFDLAALERSAFARLKDAYYREEVVQGEPVKGIFTNVAKSRSTGALLGPTNYHSYQPALRSLYEERFSRRMSFQEFQHEEIVISTDEQTINAWKEKARSSVTFTTVKEEEPTVFKTAAEAEQHFRKVYLPQLIKSGVSLETSGVASRACTDRGIIAALRASWEQERGFPGSLVHHLRPRFVEVGLHFFKHRKRVLYLSPIRPVRHASTQSFSDGMAAILSGIESHPRISRPELASLLLGEQAESAELESKKSALASDLHYLIHAGHVIEFHDGGLDLPLSPKQEAGPSPGEKEVSTDPGAVAAANPPSESSGTEVAAETRNEPETLHEEPAVLSVPVEPDLAANQDGNP